MANRSLILSGVRRTETYYFACGGLADIYRGQWTLPSGETLSVAIKSVRRYTQDDKMAADRARRVFLKEAHLWAQLHHPNIVPFHGLIFEKDIPGLVMPYYQNGNLLQFLREHPCANRLDLTCQVAAGLEYLHTLKPNPVVHGDFKTPNILMTDDHKACLTDFGVAKMLNVSGYTTTSLGGTYRWMSPEILEKYDPSPTLESDIWAFGMTVLQIYTGKVPFQHLRNDVTVALNLSRGDLPWQPPEINDTLWAVLMRSWRAEPTERPTASTLSIVLSILESQNLTTDHVIDLMDYLEQGRCSWEGGATLYKAPFISTADTLVNTATPDPEKPRKSTLSSHLRRLSLDKYIRTADAAHGRLCLNMLLRRSTDENETEPSPPTVIKDALPFRCFWPEPSCNAGFTVLNSRKTHHVQHWISWKSDDNGGQLRVPGTSSILV